MSQKASCHCGRIAFEIDAELPEDVVSCNCSICARKGHWLWFVPRAQLRLLTPEADLASYTFNKHHIQHHFCDKCGCSPFSEGADPASGEQSAAVNVRCIEGVDLGRFKVQEFDGKSL